MSGCWTNELEFSDSIESKDREAIIVKKKRNPFI
jgi:hypothetical protein